MKDSNPTTVIKRLIIVDEVAVILSVSPRQVYRMADADLMPRPMKLGGSNRWDLQVIEEWISRGCPPMNSKGGRK